MIDCRVVSGQALHRAVVVHCFMDLLQLSLALAEYCPSNANEKPVVHLREGRICTWRLITLFSAFTCQDLIQKADPGQCSLQRLESHWHARQARCMLAGSEVIEPTEWTWL